LTTPPIVDIMSMLTTKLVGEVFNGDCKWIGDGVLASNGS